MHKELAAIAGLGAAALGDRVLRVASTHASAREAFKRSTRLVDSGLPVTIRSSAGSERIEFDGGGSIRFVSARGHGVRGLSAELLLIDESVRLLASNFYHDHVPILLGREGRVVQVSGV
ncbi:MAG: hypothetical protein LBE25_13515 [Arthrobacter sp.]|nr:hypothetical protein [Arthrobacter sp.]